MTDADGRCADVLTQTVDPVDPAQRLEFGKLCVSRDGPVEDFAYAQLGWSDGFPAAVRPWCLPSVLDLTTTAFEKRPPGCEHGTVLRPAVTADAWHRVLFRLSNRAEDGASGHGRRYTLGRYLVAAAAVSPLALWEAMDRERLVALTREDQAKGFLPLPLRSRESVLREEDDVAEAFVRGALVYVLSGRPVTITAPIAERRFFEWVTAVWQDLPSVLRPLLTAGWGVGASMTDTLAITYAADNGRNAATFDPATAAWRPALTGLSSSHRPAYFASESDPSPGLCYVAELDRERDRLLGRLHEDGEAIIGDVKLDPLPNFTDGQTPKVFRSAGFRLGELIALDGLRSWICGSAGESESTAPLDLGAFRFDDLRELAAQAAVEALGRPQARPRADRFLWAFLSLGSARLDDPAHRESWMSASARVRLLVALARNEPALAAFLDAVGEGQADSLPGDAAVLLEGQLDQSVDGESPDVHRRLLEHDPMPTLYGRWLDRRAFDVAILMCKRLNDAGRVVERIRQVAPSPALGLLRSLADLNGPSGVDVETLGGLSRDQTEALLAVVTTKWRAPGPAVATARERILPWIRGLVPAEDSSLVDDPLVRLIVEEPQAEWTDAHVASIAEDVEGRRVPPSLLGSVAAACIVGWSANLAVRIRSRAEQWWSVSELWPPEIAHALLLLPARPSARSAAVKFEKCAPSGGALEGLLEEWINPDGHGAPRLGEVAGQLWRWIVATTPRDSASSPIGLCQTLAAGTLPKTMPAAAVIKRAATLLACGTGPIAETSVGAMGRAATERWHFRLLLEVFRGYGLKLSESQLQLICREPTLADLLQQWRPDLFAVTVPEAPDSGPRPDFTPSSARALVDPVSIEFARLYQQVLPQLSDLTHREVRLLLKALYLEVHRRRWWDGRPIEVRRIGHGPIRAKWLGSRCVAVDEVVAHHVRTAANLLTWREIKRAMNQYFAARHARRG